MGKHLRKSFDEHEVIAILKRYLTGNINADVAQRLLKIKRRQFFVILKEYRENPQAFSLAYQRIKPSRQLPSEFEAKIETELSKDKLLVDDKNNPIRRYNYSYIKTRLEEDHDIKVSLSSIIRRAKKKGFIKTNHHALAITEKF